MYISIVLLTWLSSHARFSLLLNFFPLHWICPRRIPFRICGLGKRCSVRGVMGADWMEFVWEPRSTACPILRVSLRLCSVHAVSLRMYWCRSHWWLRSVITPSIGPMSVSKFASYLRQCYWPVVRNSSSMCVTPTAECCFPEDVSWSTSPYSGHDIKVNSD